MELRRADRAEIAALRGEHRRGSPLSIVPGFYSRLAEEAEAFLIQDVVTGESPSPVGYVLLLERLHGGHKHVTLIELHLAAAYQTRYEDVLDLVRDSHRPTAYLARTDDCRFNATLLARGHQVEVTALVMMPEEGTESPLFRQPPQSGGDASERTGIGLVALTAEHLAVLGKLVAGGGASGRTAEHSHGRLEPAAAVAELEALAQEGQSWVVLQHGLPVAVIARKDGGDGVHELLDFAVASTGEEELALALRWAGDAVGRGGRWPAAVIDAAEAARRRIFRKAGYYSAAAYMVFYDPEVGRPSVGTVSVDELRTMIDKKEHFRLVDVLGEEHWNEGHIPGSEWIDFRVLAGEARRRFETEEPIVLYCKGFTCEAGALAADKLRQLGFTNVRDFAGGLEEWTGAGLRVERA